MALRARVPLIRALLAVSLAGSALLSPGLAAAQPKPKGAPPKQTDMELDPDKPKEEKPLPPPDPGQWGVGGKEEEGKFTPGGEKEKEREKDKEKTKEEESKPADLGPARAAYVDWVTGFGSVDNPTNNLGGPNGGKTLATSLSFVFHFSWRVADIWTIGARFPFSQANLTGPMGTGDVAKTVAPGNLEFYVRPSFQISRRLRIPAVLAITLPTAQGDLFGDTSSDTVAPNQAMVNLAASAARGWEEMPLFTPHRFGLRLGGGITYDNDSIHFAAGTGFDLMPKVGGNDPGKMTGFSSLGGVRSFAFAWVTKASFHYGFAVGPGFIEPGLRTWLVYASLPWYGASADDSGVQLVFEPAVDTRWAIGEEKSMWAKAGIGFIAPASGPLGGHNPSGSGIYGFRVHGEFQF